MDSQRSYAMRPLLRRRQLSWMQFLSAYVDASRLSMPRMPPAMRAIRGGDYGVGPTGRGRNTLDPALVGRMLTGAALDTLLTATLNRAATTAVIIDRYRRVRDDGGRIDAPNAAADRVGRDAVDWGVRIRFRSSQ